MNEEEYTKEILNKDKKGDYNFIKIKHGKPEENPGKISTRKYVKNLEEELILIDLNIEKEKIKKAEKLAEYRNFKEIHCLVCGIFLYHSGIGRFPKYCEKHRKEKRKELHSNWKKKNPIYYCSYMRKYRLRKKKLTRISDGPTIDDLH